MPNALAGESSPYLRQHADNPVDWLPWGELALARARERDVPLFVSIGYAACHWCHVMERESFTDPQIAALMNERFVCVKVDREERPDVDGVYMQAVQLLTGHGGWPLNVFLTPEQTPFFGGTYWPPVPAHGMPAFAQVLTAVAEMWRAQRDQADAAGKQLAEHLRAQAERDVAGTALGEELIERAVARLLEDYDPEHGGVGPAPKFPPHCALELLLRRGELGPALGTLRAMARGGIYDQIGGGFARYAVDATWTVPHFEKMLYDNALLARNYLRAWQLTGDELLLRTARETLDFCLRELRAADGGFYCSLDADSGGVEGAYYVWTAAELHEVLGPLADAASAYFGVSEHGNFEGANVLRADGPEPAERDEIRGLLYGAREQRTRPARDDKQVASWNALMIGALAEAGAVLGDEVYLDAARAGADHAWERMRDADGRLLRTPGGVAGFLEDNAFMLEALLTLYEACFEDRYFEQATELAQALLARFEDKQRGGFYFGALDGEALIVPRKEIEDHPIPSGASSAALGLLRLSALTDDPRYEHAAIGAIRLSADVATRFPSAFAYLLCALDFHLADVLEVALAGTHVDAFARVVRARFRPHVVLAASGPLLEGRNEGAHVCRRFACEAPVHDAEALARLLGD
jgi:uncharacterized protein YyaL (SSP411 family)